jgi:hypothetical protein
VEGYGLSTCGVKGPIHSKLNCAVQLCKKNLN